MLEHPDPVVAMRAAAALEKATRADASPLQGHRRRLLEVAERTGRQEVRWHLARAAPRLALDVDEGRQLADVLTRWLDDPSAIVRAETLQALADVAADDADRAGAVRDLLRRHLAPGSPAVRARCRLLLVRPPFRGDDAPPGTTVRRPGATGESR